MEILKGLNIMFVFFVAVFSAGISWATVKVTQIFIKEAIKELKVWKDSHMAAHKTKEEKEADRREKEAERLSRMETMITVIYEKITKNN